MYVIGVDPGSDYLGIAILQLNENRVRCCQVARVRAGGLSFHQLVQRLDPILQPYLTLNTTYILEKPPPTTRKDTKHGAQTPIGWRLGLVSGVILGRYSLQESSAYEECYVADWRERLLRCTAIYGPEVIKPTRKNVLAAVSRSNASYLKSPLTSTSSGWIGEYSCGHQIKLRTFADVQNAPENCPICSTRAVEISPAILVRDAWKTLACEVFQYYYPENYQQIVAEAKKTSRKDKDDSKLVGVADAADAFCIALSAVFEHVHSIDAYSTKRQLIFN